MFLPTKKKSNNIYKLSYHCGSDYVGKISQRFHVRIDQHVPKILKSWFDGHSEKPVKNHFSSVGQHFLESNECSKKL